MDVNADLCEEEQQAVDVISLDEPWEKQEGINMALTPALLEGLCDGCNSSRARAISSHVK